jgi:hypothetical protein
MYRTVRTRGIAGNGLFLTQLQANASRALTLAEADNPGATALVREAVATSAGPIATSDDFGAGGSSGSYGAIDARNVPDEVAARCTCLVNNAVAPALEAQGAAMTEDVAVALYGACVQDADAFAASLDEQGIDHDGCKPWYQRRVTKYAAGGALALGLLYLVVRR